MLEVKNIKVCYGQAIAISNISLEVNEGEIVSIIGSNGAGKTTLVNTISGLLHPKEGSIYYLGERIDNFICNRHYNFHNMLYNNKGYS